MIRLGSLLAVLVALAVPAHGESADWARDFFKSRDAAVGLVGRANGHGGKRGLIEPGAERTGDEAEAQKKREKELLPLRPELPVSRGPWQWRIARPAWTAEDEAAFEEFVRLIGESDCKTVHECITSPAANPHYHANNPPFLRFFADCADLPYFLRAYVAWNRKLAFSFSIRYTAHPRSPGARPGVTGNQITERYSIVGPGPDARLALATVGRFVSSEHFRVPPAYVGQHLPDFYPVALTRESIRPGTVIFDPDGHVAVVYKVSDNGLIHYIDAHPDNSLTRGIYARDFARAEPQMGAGFKRWRPQELKGYVRAADGTLHGGHVVLKADSELSDWSDEQFYGNVRPRPRLWSDGQFEINGVLADYYDYVRMRLAYPGFKFDPIEETRTRIRGICYDLHERVAAVNLAIKAGYHRRPPPPRLPNNIYATTGDWEIYSTPSRDARLKVSFEELRDEIARFIAMQQVNSKLLKYDGTDLRADLAAVYRQEAASCSISYTKSDGSAQDLSFSEITRRLFKMSFDPYHCVERRWGATSPAELKTCADGPEKRAWYDAQDRLRNQVTRTYGEPMGWTLAQLQNKQLDIGIDEEPDFDVEKVLDGRVTVADLQEKAEVDASTRRARRGNAGRPERSRFLIPAEHKP